MSVRSIAFNMPKPQRDMLIAHIDGPQPVTTSGHEWSVRNSLHAKGLLAYPVGGPINPTTTHITELGREVLCSILGDYADALVRCGALTENPPIILKHAPKIAADEPLTAAALDPEAIIAERWRAELANR